MCAFSCVFHSLYFLNQRVCVSQSHYPPTFLRNLISHFTHSSSSNFCTLVVVTISVVLLSSYFFHKQYCQQKRQERIKPETRAHRPTIAIARSTIYCSLLVQETSSGRPALIDLSKKNRLGVQKPEQANLSSTAETKSADSLYC